jgi:hypothetical protein
VDVAGGGEAAREGDESGGEGGLHGRRERRGEAVGQKEKAGREHGRGRKALT